jgi:hypothetical protein
MQLEPTPHAEDEDLEERELIAVYADFTADYGPHFESWELWQIEQYVEALAKVSAQYRLGRVAA